MAENRLLKIPLNKIRENPVALRSVNKQSDEYVGLVDSVRKNGVLNSITVREVKNGDGETVYGLIDGLHRFSAASDAGLTEIPAQVLSMDDAAVLEAQVVANVHKVETRPVEYAKQLMRILTQNPTLTITELSAKLSKSPAWLGERLGLVKLEEKISKLVDEGKVNLSNAYALSKLPPEEQPNFLDRAMTLSPSEFVPMATARVKEVRDAKRQGREAKPEGFQPVAFLRKIAELKNEMEEAKVANALVKSLGITNPVDAFSLGVKWALNMDPSSIEAQKQKDAARRAQAEEEKSKRKAEREAKKQQEAAATAASVSS